MFQLLNLSLSKYESCKAIFINVFPEFQFTMKPSYHYIDIYRDGDFSKYIPHLKPLYNYEDEELIQDMKTIPDWITLRDFNSIYYQKFLANLHNAKVVQFNRSEYRNVFESLNFWLNLEKNEIHKNYCPICKKSVLEDNKRCRYCNKIICFKCEIRCSIHKADLFCLKCSITNVNAVHCRACEMESNKNSLTAYDSTTRTFNQVFHRRDMLFNFFRMVMEDLYEEYDFIVKYQDMEIKQFVAYMEEEFYPNTRLTDTDERYKNVYSDIKSFYHLDINLYKILYNKTYRIYKPLLDVIIKKNITNMNYYSRRKRIRSINAIKHWWLEKYYKPEYIFDTPWGKNAKKKFNDSMAM